jgi:hypothetical protein
MFAWAISRPLNRNGPFSGLPLVGLGSFTVQRSIVDFLRYLPQLDNQWAFIEVLLANVLPDGTSAKSSRVLVPMQRGIDLSPIAAVVASVRLG